MIEMKKSLANLTDSQKEERLLAVFVANLLHSKQTLNDGLKPIENIYQLREKTIDFKSPRFVQAQMTLGILDEDLKFKKKEEF